MRFFDEKKQAVIMSQVINRNTYVSWDNWDNYWSWHI